MEKGFKRLIVWQKSRDLAVDIYRLSKTTQLSKDYGLKDQLCRCSVSVPSNIAEGHDRDSDRDCARFLQIAKGSLAELRTQSDIAFRIGYFSEAQFNDIEMRAIEIGKMLGALIKSKQSKFVDS